MTWNTKRETYSDKKPGIKTRLLTRGSEKREEIPVDSPISQEGVMIAAGNNWKV